MSNSVYISLQKQLYLLAMEYDNLHNILGKTQVHETSPDNTNWTKAHQTTYDLTYQEYNTAEYNVAGYSYTQPHAVRQITDKPETTSTGNDVKTKLYDYDPNGNLTNITQKTGDSDAVEKLRTNLWDEENRLRAVDITPDAEGVRPIAIYTYDAGGERVLKHSNTSVSIYLNGKKVADTIQVDAALYPSGMLVAKLGSNGSEEEQTLAYTKHYFAGTQRVSSKIGTTENLGEFLQDWFTGGIGGPVDVIGSSFGVLENAEQGVVQVYDEFDIEPPVYDSNPVFIPVQSFVHGDDELEQYFFHPDHLGSTSYITNLLGEVSQHMEYFAFGETFVEEHRSSNNSPYKFNGKELDEETGWYYYGARYYDPRVSVWLSVDPLASYDPINNSEHYIDGQHNGGVFNPMNLNVYGYTYQNPIVFVDPNGKQTFFLNTRSFSPVPKFGGAYGWYDDYKGDDRSHTTDPNASYRIGGFAIISMKDKWVKGYAMAAASTENLTTGEIGYSPSKFKVRKPVLGNLLLRKNEMMIETHNYGNNGLVDNSFDVDVMSNLIFSSNDSDNGGKILNIFGQVYGDHFPSNEVYISDSYGNAVMLGTSDPNMDPEIGPFFLGGKKDHKMSDINATIKFDKNNKIIEASSNGKPIKVDHYE